MSPLLFIVLLLTGYSILGEIDYWADAVPRNDSSDIGYIGYVEGIAVGDISLESDKSSNTIEVTCSNDESDLIDPVYESMVLDLESKYGKTIQ